LDPKKSWREKKGVIHLFDPASRKLETLNVDLADIADATKVEFGFDVRNPQTGLWLGEPRKCADKAEADTIGAGPESRLPPRLQEFAPRRDETTLLRAPAQGARQARLGDLLRHE